MEQQMYSNPYQYGQQPGYVPQQPIQPQGQPQQPIEQEQVSLEGKFLAKQEEVTKEIVSLNEQMKDMTTIHSLLNVIFGVRQRHVEYYHMLMSSMSKLSTEYKKKYASLYHQYKVNSQIKFSSEGAIASQVEGQLADMLQNTALLNTHIKFMEQSIKTLDHMIYGINQKIEVVKLMNGVKF